jgi:phenylacetate-CoA ligase
MREGDVLLAQLPQADGQKKLRPALCIATMPPFGDLLLCGISTQLQHHSELDSQILRKDPDFGTSGLSKDSLIRTGFLTTVPRSICRGRIGWISTDRLHAIRRTLSLHLIAPRPAATGTALHSVLMSVLASDNFNSRRLRAAGITRDDAQLTDLPFTTKADVLADHVANAPFGSAMTEPLANYSRFCQTSGTSTGQPMAWLDTTESWEAMLACWRRVFAEAGCVKGVDRILFAFSFGPFLGFWTAFEAAARDYMALPSGGLSSQARLQLMARYGATVLCCTPTYALRLGEQIGRASGISLDQLQVRKIIVAGEPGGSLPAVRARLDQLWNARVFDHHGMTEVGPVSYESADRPGFLQVIAEAYAAEVIDPASGVEVADGEHGELVLTNLTRVANPLIRYRTGDWVKKRVIDGQLCLEGGVLSRVDEMIVVRGVNVYPSAVEHVVRQFDGIAEFQVELRKVDAMDEIELCVELCDDAPSDLVKRLENALRDTFSMRIPVRVASALPRHEFKARRWLRG